MGEVWPKIPPGRPRGWPRVVAAGIGLMLCTLGGMWLAALLDARLDPLVGIPVMSVIVWIALQLVHRRYIASSRPRFVAFFAAPLGLSIFSAVRGGDLLNGDRLGGSGFWVAVILVAFVALYTAFGLADERRRRRAAAEIEGS